THDFYSHPFSLSRLLRHPRPTLFPYTTLFRSGKKSLFGPQPERFPCSGGQKTSTVRSRVRLRFPIDGADVFIRRTIAILAVLRANAVAILCDFAGDPVSPRKRRDYIADQLRLANGSRVPANNNQAPTGRSVCLTCHQAFPQVL